MKVAGLVTKFRPHQTKDGKPMGFVTIEDALGEMELVIFPRTWEKSGKLVRVDEILLVEGKVDNDGSTPKILVDQMTPVSPDDAQDEIIETAIPASSEAIAGKSIPDAPVAVILPGKMNTIRESDWDDDGMDPFPPDMDMELSPEDLANESALWQETEPDQPVKAIIAEKVSVSDALAEGLTYASEPVRMEMPPVVMQPIRPLPISSPEETHERKRLVVFLRSSGNLDRDVRKMKNIQGTLLSFPGKDYFAFQIFEHGKGFLIEFPNHTTKVCHELMDRLGHLVGADEYVVRIHNHSIAGEDD